MRVLTGPNFSDFFRKVKGTMPDMESSEPQKIRTDERSHECTGRKVNFGASSAKALVSVTPGPAALPLSEDLLKTQILGFTWCLLNLIYSGYNWSICLYSNVSHIFLYSKSDNHRARRKKNVGREQAGTCVWVCVWVHIHILHLT